MSERQYNHFALYLKESNIEGLKLLNFWTIANLFKYQGDKSNQIILACDIYNQFLKRDSINFINFKPELVDKFIESYQNIENTKYSYIIDEMSQVVYNHLRNFYFHKYKLSDIFEKFKNVIKSEEIIYSRLVASDMTNNSYLNI